MRGFLRDEIKELGEIFYKNRMNTLQSRLDSKEGLKPTGKIS